MYGYPAHYFSPALPMMDQFQFIRGGAGLLYGPQPGGVVNYISEPLYKGQKTNGKVGLTYGSYNLISSNNAVYGSKGDHSYGVEYFRRQGDGPQRENSDFTADYVQLRDHIFKGNNKYTISFNGYNSDHGESGGFSKDDGPGLNEFGDDQGRASKKHDRLKVSRAQLAAGLEKRLDDASQLDVTLWATAYNRYSHRQRGSSFGGFPSLNETDITTQKYYGYNGQVRYLKNYNAFGNEHTFSGGYLNYNLISPLHTERNENAPDAISGSTRARIERETHVNSFFAENRFTFGKFMMTPGVRLENITQSIDEKKNVQVTSGSLRDNQQTENVPLFGLGLSYHLTDQSQVYGNISESYKPITYSQGLPTDPTEVAASDLEESKVLNYELGYRGMFQHSSFAMRIKLAKWPTELLLRL
jgi:Fe(3+) dicitrate transport protein